MTLEERRREIREYINNSVIMYLKRKFDEYELDFGELTMMMGIFAGGREGCYTAGVTVYMDKFPNGYVDTDRDPLILFINDCIEEALQIMPYKNDRGVKFYLDGKTTSLGVTDGGRGRPFFTFYLEEK